MAIPALLYPLTTIAPQPTGTFNPKWLTPSPNSFCYRHRVGCMAFLGDFKYINSCNCERSEAILHIPIISFKYGNYSLFFKYVAEELSLD
jgi:hypothetical protein